MIEPAVAEKKNKIHNDDEVRQECEMIGSARGRGSWVS